MAPKASPKKEKKEDKSAAAAAPPPGEEPAAAEPAPTEPFGQEPAPETTAAMIKSRATTFDPTTVLWYSLSIGEVQKMVALRNLKEGVMNKNVAQRQEAFGSNEIPTADGPSLLKIIFFNFCNSITAILAFVGVVSGVFQDWGALGVVLFVILFIGIVGAKQEWDAAQSLEALKQMTKGEGRVLRQGMVEKVEINDVVVGDVVVLEQGDSVPCDVRIFESTGLQIDECLLTGETEPVKKKSETIVQDAAVKEAKGLGDWKNCAFRSCVVVEGRGKGIAVAAGLDTQVGQIAQSLNEDGDTKTALQKKMELLMYAIFGCCLILVIVVFGANRFNMTDSVILYGAAVAIAILPQSLVAVIAVAMAMSVRKMAVQKCIVRKLGSLEVLDSVTDICSDKTGTLTQNKMAVARVALGMKYRLIVSGAAMSQTATFTHEGEKKPLDMEDMLEDSRLAFEMVKCAALCGTTVLKNEGGNLIGQGNPTEVALQAFCHKTGSPRNRFEDGGFDSRGEYPFDSSIKRMSAAYYSKNLNQTYMCTKGAPERVLKLCKWWMRDDGSLSDITDTEVEITQKAIEQYAALGLRTICLTKHNEQASGADLSTDRLDSIERDAAEDNLIFLGVVGIQDPPRVESKLSVRICKRAGITVRMLTGDHFKTAAAIAKEIEIITDEEQAQEGMVMTGPAFDALSPEEAEAMDELPKVVGRCSPKTKVRMIEELHRRGRVCAMTGDGFNDSPSIKAADIGCAMGSGTDVTKGVADFVITDDNFSTIVKALAEGRRIALAIKKFVTHLLCGNMAETVVLVLGLGIMQDGQSVFILSPLQILWLNLFTSSPPAIGLSVDDAPDDVLRVGPNMKGLFTPELAADTLAYGIVMGGCSLASFTYVLYSMNDGVAGTNCNRSTGEGCDAIWRARSTAFCILYFCMLIHAYNVRFSRRSLVTMPMKDNPWLWGSFVFGVVTIIPMLYVEVIAKNIFVHSTIDWEWFVVLVAVLIFTLWSEVYKLIKNTVDPLPIQVVTEEEAEMERLLFKGSMAAEEAKQETVEEETLDIVRRQLTESRQRQTSFSPGAGNA